MTPFAAAITAFIVLGHVLILAGRLIPRFRCTGAVLFSFVLLVDCILLFSG